MSALSRAGLSRAGLSRAGERAAVRMAGLLRVRWVARMPIWIYRKRLGLVFGSRLLMLEHTGRTSGLARHVVLEVIDGADPGRYVVASGFSTRAQWYRNIIADPQVRVWVGSRKPAHATARPLPADRAADVLRRYATDHPRAWATLRPVLESTLGTRISLDGTDLPLVALDLTSAEAR